MKTALALAASFAVVGAAGGGVLVVKASPAVSPCAAAAAAAFRQATGRAVEVRTAAIGPLGSASGADVVVAIGARFDDRVTGDISKFAPHAKILHIDIDPSSISKTVRVNVPVVSDVKPAIEKLIGLIQDKRPGMKEWLAQIAAWKQKHPMKYENTGQKIHPSYVIEKIGELTKHRAIVVTGVGQHQMWAAQWYQFDRPRTMLTSGGLGTMGYGFPAAIGAQLGLTLSMATLALRSPISARLLSGSTLLSERQMTKGFISFNRSTTAGVRRLPLVVIWIRSDECLRTSSNISRTWGLQKSSKLSRNGAGRARWFSPS
jgi:hypothetical protein